ncbi:MAG: DEAD/DEAH box helicase [Bacteroidia bacterium]|nr:DEAD/DEAH box helicase [Bacteroidia bacterium]
MPWYLMRGERQLFFDLLARTAPEARGMLVQSGILWELFFQDEAAKDILYTLPDELVEWIFSQEAYAHIFKLKPLDTLTEIISDYYHDVEDASPRLLLIWSDILIMRGHWFSEDTLPLAFTAKAEYQSQDLAVAFMTGHRVSYPEQMTDLLKVFRKEPGNQGGYFQHLGGVIFLMALLLRRDVASLKQVGTLSKVFARQSFWSLLLHGVSMMAAYLEQRQDVYNQFKHNLKGLGQIPLMKVWGWLLLNWCDDTQAASDDQDMILLLPVLKTNGYVWLELEIMAALVLRHPHYRELYRTRVAETEYQSLVGIREVVPTWQKSLEALSLVAGKQESTSVTTRLVWFINPDRREIMPYEQRQTAKGWSGGKKVALRRLVDGELTELLPQDRQVIGAIRQMPYTNQFYLDTDIALEALAGHPHLLLDPAGVSLELVRTDVALSIAAQKDGSYVIQLSAHAERPGTLLIKETPTRYQVVVVREQHLRIAQILGGTKMKVPAEGKGLLAEVTTQISSLVHVQSDLTPAAQNLPVVAGDPRIHVHILPQGEGFRLETYVKPFGVEPPYVRPAKGREHIIAEIKGQRIQASRDLRQEKKNEQSLIKASEVLQTYQDGTHEWVLEQPQDCLEVLLDLEKLQGDVTIEWPEGTKLKVLGKVSFPQLSVRVSKGKEWFEASGEITLDSGSQLSLMEMLRLLENTPGRFVELAPGEFIALTDEFRKRLDEIKAWSDVHKDSLRVHPLAVSAWEEALSEAGTFKRDKSWQDRVKRLKEARHIQPAVPPTLSADLRSYQEEGFRWLAQLAHWEVGACLADDMGLGKTLQTLALLLLRAEAGPSLVVAPPTVARNWVAETRRFAPTLNPILYTGADRSHMLLNLQPYDLLITSYSLLQSDIESLGAVSWNVAVLDEAQSIKNYQAKRSKAAMELQAGFRMITTGTPIENHLSEFWNLFQFINPGLLGTLKDFTERYATPIEKNQNQLRRRQLQKLIQPFILRRRKHQVLDELPSKTEITLSVELPQADAVRYEAMRLDAIRKLQQLDSPAGQKHLRILAEITRLRQFCCHPRLVDSSASLDGAKLTVLQEVVQGLRENGHKVLIFSQFVRFLEIVREWIDAEHIPYQYLDGSTPQKQREVAIKEFQAGKGDVFLISLKAGGVGLNLTAADYVIHLDPWWNPAVEDQASDRAHRIGQERPVTIYRLVTKGTIEEKIVKLHQEKRELADSLLEGTDASGKLTAEALLGLLQEG